MIIFIFSCRRVYVSSFPVLLYHVSYVLLFYCSYQTGSDNALSSDPSCHVPGHILYILSYTPPSDVIFSLYKIYIYKSYQTQTDYLLLYFIVPYSRCALSSINYRYDIPALDSEVLTTLITDIFSYTIYSCYTLTLHHTCLYFYHPTLRTQRLAAISAPFALFLLICENQANKFT